MKEMNIVIDSPWKKVVLVGGGIIIFVIITEMVNKYFETNPYFIYVLIILAAILTGIFFIFLKRKNKSKPVLKK